MIRSSTVSVFLLDPQQGFRDRENTTVEDIKSWADELGVEMFEEISLEGGQFRCAGSKEYVDWIDRMLGFTEKDPAPDSTPCPNVLPFPLDHIAEEIAKAAEEAVPGQNRFSPFQVEFFDDPAQLENALRKRADKGQTARLLASYARSWKTEKAALPHNLPPHLMDFHEPYQEAGSPRHWSKVWNYVPKGKGP